MRKAKATAAANEEGLRSPMVCPDCGTSETPLRRSGPDGPKGGVPEEHRLPPWLQPLLSTSFFVHCQLHVDSHHRRKCNMYCLDCIGGALCSLCLLTHHRGHHTIQIRRASYHDVVKVSEIQKVFDIAGVQSYIIHGASVIFLNERPKSKRVNGVTYTCEVCHRSLLGSFRFCSLGCKIAGDSSDYHGHRKKTLLQQQKSTREIGSEDSCMRSSHGSGRSIAKPCFTPSPSTLLPAATRFSGSKRRKGIPHRAPFF